LTLDEPPASPQNASLSRMIKQPPAAGVSVATTLIIPYDLAMHKGLATRCRHANPPPISV
jgi:hypothetical protein